MTPSTATDIQPETRPAAEIIRLPARGQPAHGAAEVVCVQAVLEKNVHSARTLDRLCRMSGESPICLHPTDLPSGEHGIEAWQRFCDLLQERAIRRHRKLRRLATCIHSHHVPLGRFHAATDAVFGQGERYVFLDSLQLQSHRDQRVCAVTDHNWRYLWEERRTVRPVYGGLVKSACPLLADEVAMTVVPGVGLLSPAHSAWLPVQLDITALADGSGTIDESMLRSVVDRALRIADRNIDCLRWPGRRRSADAWQNRRIAFCLTGIGDLVHRTGADPADLSTLHIMGQLVNLVRQALDESSGRLATERGELPSLARACPAISWFDGPHGPAWRSQFDAARRSAAIRHRNLLVMSPDTVVPAIEQPSPGYADLLPLIAAADAWAFAGAPGYGKWNATQFKHFHRRARAVIQGSQGTARIAAGV